MGKLTVRFVFDDPKDEEPFYDTFIVHNMQAFQQFMGVDNSFLQSPSLTDKREFMQQAASETYRINYFNMLSNAQVELFKRQVGDELKDKLTVEDKSRKPAEKSMTTTELAVAATKAKIKKR